MSSARAVACARKALNARRAGHAGSLDPLATGVLPVALGEATKTVAFAMRAPKEYDFTIRWGASTRSHDADGEILERDDAPAPSLETIHALTPRFIGAIQQRPPGVSALKIGGRRAYALARAGIEPQLAVRQVWVAELRATAHRPDERETDFVAQVGQGFYVRAFARDLAQACGALGHVARLRRSRVGPFSLDAAIKIGDDGALACDDPLRMLAPLDVALAAAPRARLSPGEAARLRRGQATFARAPLEPGEPWRYAPPADESDTEAAIFACDWEGRPVALARLERGALKPTRVFGADGVALGDPR